MNKKYKEVIWLLFAVLPISLFNFYLSNKYLPLSEGWWITYAYLMRSGLEIFKDFQLPAAPLFVYMNYLIYKLIDQNYLIVKYIGIATNAGLFLCVYLILKRYFKNKISSLATIAASFLYITSPVFAEHDYHVIVDLFVVLSIYILIISSGAEDKKIQFVGSLTAGIVVSALFFTKQNVGIFIIFGQLIALVIYLRSKTMVFGYILGITAFALLFSYLIEYSILGIVNQLVFQSDSKGSAIKVLFRFLIDGSMAKILSIAILIVFSFRFFLININIIKEHKLINKIIVNIEILLTFLQKNKNILFFVSMAIFYLIAKSFNSEIILVLVISYIFYNVVYNLRKDNNYALIFITMLLLLYTNTQTGGFANWGTILASALFFAVIFNAVNIHYSATPIYALVIISCATIAYNKLISPYSFWGATQSSVLKKQFPLPYERLKRIYVGEDTYILFSKIKNAINNYSKNSNDIYLYPNIPIFYYLHHKIPPTNVIGQWFDFINREQVSGELTYLKTTPPKLIILFDPPKSVYEGHEKLIGRDLEQGKIISLLDDYVSSNRYKIIDQNLYCSDPAGVREFKKIKVEFIVRNNLYDNYSIKNLLEIFPELEVISYSNSRSGIQTNQINLNTKLNIGDKINLYLDFKNLNRMLNILGDYNKFAGNIGIDSCFYLKILNSNEY